jgi:eukaryotic-like serine/threonine-protein kinase
MSPDSPDANVDGAAGDDERGGGPPRALGRYRVVAELGRGSTSIVYLGAVDGPSGYSKLFALKLLRPALAADPAMVALFLMEARIGAHLSHPNVVSTLEIEDREAQPFIVMEYLDGKPLQELITSARIAFTPLPLHMHLAVLSGALEGLAHAHAAVEPGGAPLGIVHRDVSPHNVFVTVSGTPKVLDFGFAQTAHSPNTMLTSAARVAYMSPEQSIGALVDARSDLFSIGVMMWEAVTRRRFWSEEASKADILRALRSGELPPHRIPALAKSSVELRSMIVKATSPDPDDRYASAGEFQEDLRFALSEVTPPTFALRDLGQRVVTLFAADRARLQRAIEEQATGATEAAPPRRSAPPAARSRPPEPPSVLPIEHAATATEPSEHAATATEPSEHAAAATTPSEHAADARPAWYLNRHTLATAVLGLLVVIGAVFEALRTSPSAPQPSATAASMVAPPEKAAPPSVEAPPTPLPFPSVAAPATPEAPQPGVPEVPSAASSTSHASQSVAPPSLPVHPAASRPAAGQPGPMVPKPTAPVPSVERFRGPGSSDQGPMEILETPPVARPPRPIDSSNPYSP